MLHLQYPMSQLWRGTVLVWSIYMQPKRATTSPKPVAQSAPSREPQYAFPNMRMAPNMAHPHPSVPTLLVRGHYLLGAEDSPARLDVMNSAIRVCDAIQNSNSRRRKASRRQERETSPPALPPAMLAVTAPSQKPMRRADEKTA